MPIQINAVNALKPQLIQITPQSDQTGWEVLIDLLVGNWVNGQFIELERTVKKYNGADVPGLTGLEKTTLAQLLTKMIVSISHRGASLTLPTRDGMVWHE